MIDAQAVVQPWGWCAAYAEALNVGRPGRPGAVGLVRRLHAARVRRGLPGMEPPCLDRFEALLLGWASLFWWPGVGGAEPDSAGRRDALGKLMEKAL